LVTMASKWLSRNVLLVSLSAFFADAGYQALIAGFPIFLVIYLRAPVYYLGIAFALAYGIGSLFSYFGGKLADRYGKKRIAILGNALIPILSFTGFAATAAQATAIFSSGWWARNFRTPARRAILADITANRHKGKAFGFLNALDVGGGVIAIIYLAVLLSLHIKFSTIFLLTAIPIAISTVCLVLIKYKPRSRAAQSRAAKSAVKKANTRAYRGILVSTAIYSLAFYSLGFPVLTIAQRSGGVIGVGSYAVFLLSSAIFGFLIGSRRIHGVKELALLGYMLAGLGSLLVGLYYHFSLGIIVSYLAVGILGLAAGVIETLEPAIVSIAKGPARSGSSMGALTTSRSIGLFVSNIVLGVLYVYGPLFSYGFAFAVAIVAGAILLIAGRGFKIQN